MEKAYNLVGAYLGLMCEPAEGSPMPDNAKYQIIRLVEVTTYALCDTLSKEENYEEIYSLCKKFNDEVKEKYPDSIEKLKSYVLEEIKEIE